MINCLCLYCPATHRAWTDFTAHLWWLAHNRFHCQSRKDGAA